MSSFLDNNENENNKLESSDDDSHYSENNSESSEFVSNNNSDEEEQVYFPPENEEYYENGEDMDKRFYSFLYCGPSDSRPKRIINEYDRDTFITSVVNFGLHFFRNPDDDCMEFDEKFFSDYYYDEFDKNHRQVIEECVNNIDCGVSLDYFSIFYKNIMVCCEFSKSNKVFDERLTWEHTKERFKSEDTLGDIVPELTISPNELPDHILDKFVEMFRLRNVPKTREEKIDFILHNVDSFKVKSRDRMDIYTDEFGNEYYPIENRMYYYMYDKTFENEKLFMESYVRPREYYDDPFQHRLHENKYYIKDSDHFNVSKKTIKISEDKVQNERYISPVTGELFTKKEDSDVYIGNKSDLEYRIESVSDLLFKLTSGETSFNVMHFLDYVVNNYCTIWKDHEVVNGMLGQSFKVKNNVIKYNLTSDIHRCGKPQGTLTLEFNIDGSVILQHDRMVIKHKIK